MTDSIVFPIPDFALYRHAPSYDAENNNGAREKKKLSDSDSSPIPSPKPNPQLATGYFQNFRP